MSITHDVLASKQYELKMKIDFQSDMFSIVNYVLVFSDNKYLSLEQIISPTLPQWARAQQRCKYGFGRA